MKILLLIFLLLWPTQSRFPDSSYSDYTWEQFYELPEANQGLDFANPDMDLLQACVFFATNEQRELKKKSQFTFSSTLRDAAAYHSQQMVEKNFFNHMNSRDAANRTPDKRVIRFGGNYRAIGENIAFFSTEKMTYLEAGKKLVYDWMHSPEHKATLLDGNFSSLGCGVAIKKWKVQNGEQFYLVYGTQDFGGNPQ